MKEKFILIYTFRFKQKRCGLFNSLLEYTFIYLDFRAEQMNKCSDGWGGGEEEREEWRA